MVAVKAKDGEPDGVTDADGVKDDTCKPEGGTFVIDQCIHGKDLGGIQGEYTTKQKP